GAGDYHDPSQPARVGPAPSHSQAVEDEGGAGEEDVEEGVQGEIDGLLSHPQLQGGRLIGYWGCRPGLGDALGGQAVHGDQDQPDGDAGDGGDGPEPGQCSRETVLDGVGDGDQAAQHEDQAEDDGQV